MIDIQLSSPWHWKNSGGDAVAAVAVPAQDMAVYLVVHNVRAKKLDGAFKLGLVDILSLARPAPVFQGGHNRKSGKAAAHVIRISTVGR